MLFQTPKYAYFYSMVVLMKPSAKYHLENSMQVNSCINYPTIIMPYPHSAKLNIMIWTVYEDLLINSLKYS